MLFHIVAYNKPAVNGEELVDKVVIRLIDTTPDSAMERAKLLVPRNFYFLAEIVEYKKEE